MRKYLIAAAMLIVCTAGIYAGLRYRKDVYLPEKELQEDYERLTEEIDNIRPDIHFENEKQASDENNSPLEKQKIIIVILLDGSRYLKLILTIPLFSLMTTTIIFTTLLTEVIISSVYLFLTVDASRIFPDLLQ